MLLGYLALFWLGRALALTAPLASAFSLCQVLSGFALVAVVYGLISLYLDGRGTLPRWRRGWRAMSLVLLAAELIVIQFVPLLTLQTQPVRVLTLMASLVEV